MRMRDGIGPPALPSLGYESDTDFRYRIHPDAQRGAPITRNAPDSTGAEWESAGMGEWRRREMGPRPLPFSHSPIPPFTRLAQLPTRRLQGPAECFKRSAELPRHGLPRGAPFP